MAYPEDVSEIENYLLTGEAQLEAQVVTELLEPLPIYLPNERSLMTETLEAAKRRANTSAAILNTGLFLKPLEIGEVNQNDLHQMLPHPMHLIRVTLKGTDFIRFVLEVEKNRDFLRRFRIVGMGFRGEIFGEIAYTGFSYDRVNHQVLWQGETIDPEASYTFVTVDHWMFIPFFPTIEIAGEITFLFPEFIRTVLGDYLKAVKGTTKGI